MKKVLLLIASVFIAHLCAYTQPGNVLGNVITKLKVLSNDKTIEKAYLQFDKPYYAAGDTMYYKAYVMLGERNNLSKSSGILYVDLIDPDNNIINTEMLQLAGGVAWGDFALPAGLGKGNYRVRAYTRYMLNTPEYFFDKTIPVGSIGNSSANSTTNTTQALKADIQFFPEGGNLMEDMGSKVAFKAVGTNGLGIGVKGAVVDNTNTQVAEFAATHLGMGSFRMIPEAGKTYRAKVTFADGTQSIVDLPAPQAKGIAIAVKDTLDKVFIEIRCNKAYFKDNINKDINLVMYDSGVLSSANAKLDSRDLQLSLAKEQFPSGVLQVTLFSETGEPMSERLVFLKNKDLLNLDITSDKATYKKRGRVQLKLNASEKGMAADGHFSVAVIDENKVPFDESKETTILSYLLLSSELRGYIERPNYYFTANTDQVHADLDALMLTQGYRRFTWKQLLNNETAFTYKPEPAALSISGVVKRTNGTFAEKKDLLLKIDNNTLTGKTDDQGKFHFDNLVFPDGMNFTLQAAGSAKERNQLVFNMDKPAAPPIVVDRNQPGNMEDVNQLMSVYLDNFRQQQDWANGGTNAPGIHADQVVSGSDISNASSLTAALKDHLNGVSFVKGIPYLKGEKDPALLVIDGKISPGNTDLDNISPATVSNVSLLKGANAGAYGVYGKAGVLVINTRSANAGAESAMQSQVPSNRQAAESTQNYSYNDIRKGNYRSSNIGGAGHADQVISGDQVKDAPTLSSGLNGLARGVNFVNGVPYLQTAVVLSGGQQVAEPMYVVVDGTPVDRNIDLIAPISVETVEILKGTNASIYGVVGGAGVIVITTRTQAADQRGTEAVLRPGNLEFSPKGFYKAREFYSPKYEVNLGSSRPDLRSTIYWQPELATDKDGNASFEYYNADGTGTYRVLIEGIDDKGNIGRQVYRYKVE
ncbi:MAG: TonB-dependent receptor plug domain-containing protein [Bacteroidetes bacterium]|nr:TonB-dependent receptor plug domain-containing protein [Bacteroidota bacterium]